MWFNDFTVAYVAGNSNTQLPVWYRVAATWGAHEGSLLLWVLLMSGWTLAVAVFSRRVPADIVARVLAVMGMVCAGFLAFILFTSGPFARTLPAFPVEGRDLNPLLQDPGLDFSHPPLLYMGYVGFSVAFAFAIAALLSGRLDSAFTRFCPPVDAGGVGVPDAGHRARLGVGLLRAGLGRLVVLGPGGERLLYAVAGGYRPAALAGGHRTSAPALRRGRCCCPSAPSRCACWAPSWCAPGCWCRCTPSPPTRRAGCLSSPFMVLVTGGSLLLFAVRGHRVRSRVNNALWSRESLLLGNNVLLMAAMLVVLLGTLLPLVHKQLGLGSISVGEPFFNTMFTWLMVPFALLLGVGPLVRWGRDRPRNIRTLLLTALVSTLVLSVLLPWLLEDKNHRHDGGGDGDGLLDCGAGGGRSRTARVPRHEKPLSATGEWWRRTSGWR